MNKNERKLFSGLHSSNSLFKLIAKVADWHSITITQVNKRCVECGVVSLQMPIRRIFFYFVGHR